MSKMNIQFLQIESNEIRSMDDEIDKELDYYHFFYKFSNYTIMTLILFYCTYGPRFMAKNQTTTLVPSKNSV